MYTVSDIMVLAEFPPESVAFFTKIISVENVWLFLTRASERYMNKENCEDLLEQIASQANIHRYSADMLLLLTAACKLGEEYRKRGYSEDLFKETLLDLGYKLRECLTVYGIHGTFVFPWFERFYDCTRFKLGRLQYEFVVLEENYGEFGTKGDTVLNCHIPSSGTLSMESVHESLKLAYDFFGFDKPMIVMCASWMLYPLHYPLFPEESNLQKFYHLFKLEQVETFTRNFDAWRIFGTVEEDVSLWPRKTALQKNFYDFLSQGNLMGYGRGFLSYTPSSV